MLQSCPEPSFPQLRERLLRAGVAPRHVSRYISELTDHLADLTAEEQTRGLPLSAAHAAARVRLGDLNSLADAMISQRHFRSLSSRAPLAVFTLTPLALLFSLWFVSLFLLSLGWHLFMPAAATPFGTLGPHTLFDPRNIYFQLTRALFFCAPVLVGWYMELTASRQRLKPLWPISSLALLGLLAATVGVRAYPNDLPTGFGHIRLSFALRSLDQTEYALIALLIALVPYLLWKLRLHLALNA